MSGKQNKQGRRTLSISEETYEKLTEAKNVSGHDSWNDFLNNAINDKQVVSEQMINEQVVGSVFIPPLVGLTAPIPPSPTSLIVKPVATKRQKANQNTGKGKKGKLKVKKEQKAKLRLNFKKLLLFALIIIALAVSILTPLYILDKEELMLNFKTALTIAMVFSCVIATISLMVFEKYLKAHIFPRPSPHALK